MTVVVRADAGVELGVGHIVRCSALLRRLEVGPESVELVTRSVTPRVRELVDEIGWQVRLIGEQIDEQADATSTLAVLPDIGDVDLLVVDHYSLGASWERRIRDVVGRLVVIDDLADREHSCDVVIDPTLTNEGADRYRDLVDESTILFLGPAYVLLSPEYDRMTPRVRSGEIRSWLVYLGGATGSSDLEPLLAAFQELDTAGVSMTVVLGRAFVGADRVQEIVESMQQVSVVEWTDQMPRLLADADCAIGATGGAQWERCAAGLPTLTVLTADNQTHDAAAFEAAGATKHLGLLSSMTVKDWHSALTWAYSHPVAIAAMAHDAAAIVASRHTVWENAAYAIRGKS